ncbi:Nicotinamide phosphoribosyltransferase [Burkholderia cepacia]|nr:Nicotinamide phosphoribosyltransferase [Burkholderia cepacia]
MTTRPHANHRFLLRISRARSNACAGCDAAGLNDLPSEGISIAESLGLNRFAALIDFPDTDTSQGRSACDSRFAVRPAPSG